MSKLINIEFKARVEALEPYENMLISLNPDFKGVDHQVDYYFNTHKGRLKLRMGNIENALIQYDRPDTGDAKRSDVILFKHTPDDALKEILSLHLGIKTVVDKIRKIYFIDNVKFHFDEVRNLGTFIEVEAIDTGKKFSLEYLQTQCDHYFQFFGLHDEDLISVSYSDLVMGT